MKRLGVKFLARDGRIFGLFIGFGAWGVLAVLRLSCFVYNCLFRGEDKSLRHLTFVVA